MTEYDPKINQKNFKCKVCGEDDFDLREGFYYCNECGTKQELFQAVEVETVEEFEQTKHVKKIKLKKAESNEAAQLTTWECYNYILRGLVEVLLSMGAKEGLKLMALQLWAAYLRRLEVAFFNKKYVDLPKLSVRFKKSDAKAIYNHCTKKRLNRKRRRLDSSLLNDSDASSARQRRKAKRKLDESVYSQSQSYGSETFSNISTSENTLSSSTSGTSSRAIQLKFSSNARKFFKKIMPIEHLKKHEQDTQGDLECHSFNVTSTDLPHSDYAFSTLNMKQIFTILGIALNLIEDDIQLSDLVRFIAEGHVSSKNILQYFPENFAKNGMQLLKDIGFNFNRETFTDKVLREQISYFAKYVKIHEFKMPNMLALIQRYVTELHLPQDVYTFAERLFNLLPPQMKTRVPYVYPHYEARAMAYIVFVLKLLFGLDGHKEILITNSSTKINERLEKITKTNTNEAHPHLFVWGEWVEYIEMRKVIISQYSSVFATQFKESQNMDQLLEELITDRLPNSDVDQVDVEKEIDVRIFNMQRICKNVHTELSSKTSAPLPEAISFQPTLTPAHSYLKRLLLHHSVNNSSCRLVISDFMRIDHTQRTLQPHLDTQSLTEFLKKNGVHLNVEVIPCTTHRSYAGVFWNVGEYVPKKIRAHKADFNVDTKKWSNEVKSKPIVDELVFKTELDSYHARYFKEMEKKAQIRANMHLTYKLNITTESNALQSKNSDGRNSLADLSHYSIDVFKENNMEPLKNFQLNAPRYNLDEVDLFAGIKNDERLEPKNTVNKISTKSMSALKENAADKSGEDNSVTFVTTDMDYWLLLGSMATLKEYQKRKLQTKLSRSFLWLLENCAQTIGVDWSVVYEQLLAIELMFTYGIENLDEFKHCLRFKYNNPIKDFNILVNSYRGIW